MLGEEGPKPLVKRRRLHRVVVDPSLTVRPEIQVPQPHFGSLKNITPFTAGFFHPPPTPNPEIAKNEYREAGYRIEYSTQAMKLIREHRTVEFEYDPDGFVWVRSIKDDSLKDLVEDHPLTPYLMCSP